MKLYYIANIRLITTKAHSWQILKTCEAFSLQGAEVVLLTPRPSSAELDPFIHYSLKKNFHIEHVTTPFLLSWGKIGFWIRSIIFSFSTFLFLIRQQGGIVYSRDEAAIFIGNLINKKTFFEIHTSRFNFLIKNVMGKCTGLIMITKGLKDFFVSRGVSIEKCLVSPDGVDLEEFDTVTSDKPVLRKELSLPLSKKIICYTGRYRTMGATKGIDNIISWFPQVLKNIPESFLLIVGLSREELVIVKELAKEKNIPEESYHFHNFVSHDEVIRFLKSSDVLIMNYPSTIHYSSFMSPLKLFEYMASKVPIVSSDLLSLREVIDDQSVFFFTSDNSDSFVKAVSEALASGNEGNKKADEAYKLAKGLTWSNRASYILHFVRNKITL